MHTMLKCVRGKKIKRNIKRNFTHSPASPSLSLYIYIYRLLKVSAFLLLPVVYKRKIHHLTEESAVASLQRSSSLSNPFMSHNHSFTQSWLCNRGSTHRLKTTTKPPPPKQNTHTPQEITWSREEEENKVLFRKTIRRAILQESGFQKSGLRQKCNSMPMPEKSKCVVHVSHVHIKNNNTLYF